MATTPHLEAKALASPPLDDWLSILVLLQKLQERLVEDRQSWAATGGDMAHLVDALRMELQKLQSLESQVEQEIRRSLQSFSQQVLQVQVSEISSKLTAIVSPIFENTLQRFNQAVQQATSSLQDSQNYSQQFKRWGLGLLLMLCVLSSISGGCIVHLLAPQDQLSVEQWQFIQEGAILRKAWPGLSKTEQDKIMDLFRREEIKSDMP